MKIALMLVTALLILLMFSFSALALVEFEERSRSTSAVFRGASVRWVAAAEILALLGIAGPTLTGVLPKFIAYSAIGVAVAFGYVGMTHARWHHRFRAGVFTLLAAAALLLAWGRLGPYSF